MRNGYITILKPEPINEHIRWGVQINKERERAIKKITKLLQKKDIKELNITETETTFIFKYKVEVL